MPRYIAFLRAINVGGRVVPMARLRSIFEAMELDDVSTFITSGNVIFTSTKKEPSLVRAIESTLAKKLGYEVNAFLRTDEELAALAGGPALAKARGFVPTVVVGFCAAPPDAATKRRIAAIPSPVDRFVVEGRNILWLCDVKQSESKVTLTTLEKALAARATFRGVNTIDKLATKLGAKSGAGAR
jgi:uncharacterized protein (DUF1697 family)